MKYTIVIELAIKNAFSKAEFVNMVLYRQYISHYDQNERLWLYYLLDWIKFIS